MSATKNILVKLLIAFGLYSAANAIQFAKNLSEEQVTEIIRALSNPDIEPALYATAITGPRSEPYNIG